MQLEKLLKKYPELHLKRGTVTDYSGRTFKDITAYEYAYWAKDTDMCRMLEQYMDADTKLSMLRRCEAIEKDGLTYEQHGVKGSRHFDFTPLITAMNNFVLARDNGRSGNMEELWKQVGLAQGDVPTYVISKLGQNGNDDVLQRKTTYIFYTDDPSYFSQNNIEQNFENQSQEVSLYPLEQSRPWFRLGVDFALVRSNRSHQLYGVDHNFPTSASRIWDVAVDLEFIIHLNEMSTQELAQSQENLRAAEPAADTGFQNN